VSTESRRLEQVISGIALALLLIGCAIVLRPFASALLWAVVLWIATTPIHQAVLGWVNERRTVAALIMTLGAVLILLVPILIVGFSVADSARDLTYATRSWLGRGPPSPPGWLQALPLVGESAAAYWTTLAGDSQRLLKEAQRFIEPATAWLLTSGLVVGRGMLELALSILISFFMFRDGVTIGRRFRAGAARIAGARAEHLVEVAINTVRSVVYGILGTALVQGVLAGIGFLIAGVPGAVLLGLLTFFMSIVPMGPPLIWVPSVVWLYQHDAGGWALFMLLWGFFVISGVDNFVKPWLISQGSALPFILIFFGVIGGALAFGFIGVFLGPTLIAVGYRLVLDWAVVARAAAPAPAADPAAPPGA
jgi:predicted PurR-regulated permease PerM